MEPLSLAMLSGLTPRSMPRTFFDDRLEAIDYEAATDLACLSVETYTARRSYQIAAQFRRRGVPVVLGGFHATLLPEEAAQHADAVVVGEAELVWGELLADAEVGKLKARYHAPRASLVGLSPDRSLFRGRRYGLVSLVETSRGCRFGCEFCSISAYFQKDCRERPIEEVVSEVRGLRRPVFFVDDNLGAHPDRLRVFCEALIPLRCRWVGQISLHIASDRALLALMRKSGCEGVLIGFESLDGGTLDAMGKAVNLRARGYPAAIRAFRDHGLAIYATFIFGYDNDTPETFQRVFDFALEQKFFFTAFNHLVPFPGTPLYSRMEAENRLLSPHWWLEPEGRFGEVVFRPARLSPVQLASLCEQYRRRFYSLRSVVRRGLDFQANCRTPSKGVLYFMQNLLHGREVARRQGLPFGTTGEGL